MVIFSLAPVVVLVAMIGAVRSFGAAVVGIPLLLCVGGGGPKKKSVNKAKEPRSLIAFELDGREGVVPTAGAGVGVGVGVGGEETGAFGAGEIVVALLDCTGVGGCAGAEFGLDGLFMQDETAKKPAATTKYKEAFNRILLKIL